MKILGAIFQKNLQFQGHIRDRTDKARKAANALLPFSNSRSGLTPAALRTLYTTIIRPILIYGSQIYNHKSLNIRDFQKIKYQALRKTSGAYYGSSHQKLRWICNIKPIHSILDHALVSYVSRLSMHPDPLITAILNEPTSKGFSYWTDGTDRHRPTPYCITRAWHSAVADPDELSLGGPSDRHTFPLSDLSITHHSDESSFFFFFF